jgi:vacuolar-type H+-ATPase subunit I/STV1
MDLQHFPGEALLKKTVDICNYFYYSLYSYSTMTDESEREVKEEEREEIKDEAHELEDVEQDGEEEREKQEEDQEESG